MRTNYVLIDYENVQPALEELSVLDAEHFKIIVFLGSKQTKMLVKVALALQPMGDRARYIQISGNGRNALDFHIAYYIGQLAAADKTIYFHIISKDKGFDPLIQHLKDNKVSALRSIEIDDIPLVKAAKAKTSEEKLAVIIESLQLRRAPKPKTVKTLSSTINSIFPKQLPEKELAIMIKGLQVRNYVKVEGTKVIYP